MVDVTSQEFQAAIATAAFAAATAATSSMAAPQNTPQGAWAHQGYPAHLQPQAHNPYTMQPMMRQYPNMGKTILASTDDSTPLPSIIANKHRTARLYNSTFSTGRSS